MAPSNRTRCSYPLNILLRVMDFAQRKMTLHNSARLAETGSNGEETRHRRDAPFARRIRPVEERTIPLLR